MFYKNALAWAVLVGQFAIPNAHADSFETAYTDVLPLFKKCIPQTDSSQEYLSDQGARMVAAFSEEKKLDLELFKKSYSEICDLKQSLNASGFGSDKGKAQPQSEGVAQTLAQKCDPPSDRKAHFFEVTLKTTATVREFEYPTSIGRFEPNAAANKQCKDAGLYDCIEVDIRCENPTYLGIPFVGGRESRTCTSKVRGYELSNQPVCVPQVVAEAKPADPSSPSDASKNVAPDLTDVAKNADGSVLHLNQYDADSYCRNQGLRLPTARELGLYAQSLGAEGVSETAKDGYLPVNGLDTAGHPDGFYYSFLHYQRPSGDLESSNAYWSSTIDPEHSNVAYSLNGFMGVIVGLNRDFAGIGAVRCVRSR